MRTANYLLACLFTVILGSDLLAQVTVETITSPFNASGGIAIDDSGIVYVSDFGLHLNTAGGTQVFKIMPSGTVVEFATGLHGASGNNFDSHGNLLQSNIAGNVVSKIDPGGSVSTFASSDLQNPVGLAVGAGDIVYVANCGSNSITKISPQGAAEVWLTDSLLQCPNGLAIDADGTLYTCNFKNGNILKITPDRQVTVLATLPGGRCGHLTYFEGNLYAVARCAHQIYRVTLAGEISLIAGSGERGNHDGPGPKASFNFPNGIRAKRVGDTIELFVNDAVELTGDCTSVPLDPIIIRKITIKTPR